MKLVFTRNELVTMVKTTMSMPGLMKKFLTDDYIITTFETKISELTKKTTAIRCDKCDNEYVIALDEVFVLELINEFGSLVNAIITLTIGAGTRMKLVADKYKVKEDDSNNTSSVDKDDTDIPVVKLNYGIYNTYDVIRDILPNIKNTALIKRVLKINDIEHHSQYYKNRIRHQLGDVGYIDGLVLIEGAVYALYGNVDERKNISIYNIKAYELGIIIDDKQLLGEVNKDDIKLLKSLSIVNPSDIHYLFFDSIDDIKYFILDNNLNPKNTKPTEKIPSTFYDLDKSLIAYTFLVKNNVIPVDDYDKSKIGLIRGTTHIDGLIYHNGNIYEIRPENNGTNIAIYLVKKDEYILAGNINKLIDTKVKTDDIEYEYEININNSDDTQSIWLIFFRTLDNMHLFLDKNFKL